jgi:hypothetical protein
MLGKCYQYALETFFDLHANLSCGTLMVGGNTNGFCPSGSAAPHLAIPELGASPVLVHGLIWGDSGEIKDKQFGHAWIEGNGYVVDCGSAEKSHLLVERDVYYQYWRIDPAESHRYTFQEATEFILATGWDSGWKQGSAEQSRSLAQPADAIADTEQELLR